MNAPRANPDVQVSSAIPSRARLAAVVLVRSVIFSALFGVLLFSSAGTLRFWQVWVFGAFYVVPIVVFLLLLVVIDPQAANRRLEGKERESTQRRVIRYSAPLYVLVLLAPGFDHRFGWTREVLAPVPAWVSVAFDFLALAGIILVVWTIWVNRYAARTVRIEEGQRVISTGPYWLIRHPMYAGLALAQLAMPAALGSIVTVPLFAALMSFYVVRLLNEEKLLAHDLPGYAEYCLRTRYRLVPYIW